MQLHLLTRLAPRAEPSRRDPPTTVPGAWRDSAISQLDAIAAANERLAAARLRRQAAALATVGAVALLVSAALWRPPPAEPVRPMAAAAIADARPVSIAARPHGPAPVVAASPLASVVVAPVAAKPEAQPAAPAAANEDPARVQRVAQAADARRKTAALERARADEARRLEEQQRRQQDEDEQAKQRHLAEAALERAAAAEQLRRQAVLLAQAAPRGVREACASSGGFLAEQFCQVRECRKPDQQGDAVCLRLRDIELARLQHTADR